MGLGSAAVVEESFTAFVDLSSVSGRVWDRDDMRGGLRDARALHSPRQIIAPRRSRSGSQLGAL